MKCKECNRKLNSFYYLIAGKEFCKGCSLEMISDIQEFKVELNKKGGKNEKQIISDIK